MYFKQRSCVDMNSPYKRKCWINSVVPLDQSLLWVYKVPGNSSGGKQESVSQSNDWSRTISSSQASIKTNLRCQGQIQTLGGQGRTSIALLPLWPSAGDRMLNVMAKFGLKLPVCCCLLGWFYILEEGLGRQVKGTLEWEFFDFDFEFCTILC